MRQQSDLRAWVPTNFSNALSGRRARDTAPEMRLRSSLHRAGFRFRLHRSLLLRTRADIVFSGARVAVFVDGCFWHGCPRHGRRLFNGPNASRWAAKMRRNRARDRRTVRRASAIGWHVFRFWECEILDDVDSVIARMHRFLR